MTLETIPTITVKPGPSELTMDELEAYAKQKAAELAAAKEEGKVTRKRLSQEERVQRQIAEDQLAIEAWNQAFEKAGGDVRLVDIPIPRVPYKDLPDSAGAWNLRGMLGKDVRPRIIVDVILPDGSVVPFRAASRSAYDPDWRLIMLGHTDPSGGFWQPYNVRETRGGLLVRAACLNGQEPEWGWLVDYKPHHYKRLIDFDLEKGRLTNSISSWPAWARKWFEIGHPDYEDEIPARIEPWVVQG